jgi:hypothetical protein
MPTIKDVAMSIRRLGTPGKTIRSCHPSRTGRDCREPGIRIDQQEG